MVIPLRKSPHNIKKSEQPSINAFNLTNDSKNRQIPANLQHIGTWKVQKKMHLIALNHILNCT